MVRCRSYAARSRSSLDVRAAAAWKRLWRTRSLGQVRGPGVLQVTAALWWRRSQRHAWLPYVFFSLSHSISPFMRI